MNFLQKLFGSRNDRLVRKMSGTVAKINALEPAMQALTDAELRAKTDHFKARYKQGETLEQLLPEAFAVVREASKRSLKMRHFDVQLIGGMVLHQGKIAEMRTGEGKTLVETLPAYLNSLTGKGVHIVTVNDYLVKRDAQWMGPLYEFLGLTTGVNVAGMTQLDKRLAYQADITYGTNNEFGFDYLRDNLAFNLEEKVQRELNFAIVDEVDSILIDEARTPLIISGQAESGVDLYQKINELIPSLIKQEKADSNEGESGGDGDFYLDEKTRQAFLTERGHQKIEEMLVQKGLLQVGQSLYDASNIILMHHVNAALRAHTLFNKDVDYIVQNNEIVIVDEHTGRTMPGRRWSEGLHQAVEAKEHVTVQNENQTLASITFQNYFRMYNKLAGMTGTADTEAYEFQQIYGLEVVVIPTNKAMVRRDLADQVYLTMEDRYKAIILDIKDCLNRKQPVLVGTASIEASEYLAQLLQKEKIQHQVLNAKFHEKEAQIIAEAGRPGAVTISTNMAGRGTDIVLGGNLEAEIAALNNPSEADIQRVRTEWKQRHEQVLKAGGLHVIGSERHESRRIDNQLRGRSGRQGDPGSSRFYLSLQDNLLRIFASDRVSGIMQKLGMKEGESIEHPWVNKAIENAQRKVEGQNFEIRKQLLEYDDVANDQRKVIYSQRSDLMNATDISDTIKAIRESVVEATTNQFIPQMSLEEQWDISGLEKQFFADFALQLPIQQWLEQEDDLHEENLRRRLLEAVIKNYENKEALIGSPVMRQLEKSIMLQFLDQHWRDHLASMDYLRHGIHLRGYAQKNPKQEYKRESFDLFSSMLEKIKYDVITTLSKVEIRAEHEVAELEQQRHEMGAQNMTFNHAEIPEFETALAEGEEEGTPQMAHVIPFVRREPKVGRNDPCPCGSGKKYKQCHGRLEDE